MDQENILGVVCGTVIQSKASMKILEGRKGTDVMTAVPAFLVCLGDAKMIMGTFVT